jgi:2-phospho-L-lactate guanylyltransferase
MSVAAVIPVKPYAVGKSRLATVLNDAQRIALNRNMFRHVLRTTLETPVVENVIVISSDNDVLSDAEKHGAHAILEGEPSNLNAALGVARKAALALDASGLLILPADLAKIDSADLMALLKAGDELPPLTSRIVIAPDAKRTGTNALYLQPVDTLEFSFGADSFKNHQRAGETSGYSVAVFEGPNLGFDVDEPIDLKNLDENFWRV